jgi:hypothetical protein
MDESAKNGRVTALIQQESLMTLHLAEVVLCWAQNDFDRGACTYLMRIKLV